MKCPKCGHDNPQGTLFCEECDWRLDQTYRPEKKRNPMAFAGVSLVVGVIAIALSLVSGLEAGGIIVGAVGMILSGYSVNLPRYMPDANKGLCTALSGIGIVFSVIGFLVGIASYAGGI